MTVDTLLRKAGAIGARPARICEVRERSCLENIEARIKYRKREEKEPEGTRLKETYLLIMHVPSIEVSLITHSLLQRTKENHSWKEPIGPTGQASSIMPERCSCTLLNQPVNSTRAQEKGTSQ